MMNEDIANLMVYYSTNKLSVHPKKSTILLFRNKNGQHKYETITNDNVERFTLNCRLNDNPITIVNNEITDGGCVKILGIYLDSKLDFEFQGSKFFRVELNGYVGRHKQQFEFILLWSCD